MTSPHALRCDEFRALASSRLDGELDELSCARLERHLGVCAACTSWTHDAASVVSLLHEATSVAPAWSSESLVRSLRWRFVRAGSVGAAAASAAAVAAFVLAQPGGGLLLFSSGSGEPVAESLCASCMKKQTLEFAARARTESLRVNTAPARMHVSNPLIEP